MNEVSEAKRRVLMLKSNNSTKGRTFQIKASKILAQYFGVGFQIEHPIAIGNPPKTHKFDLVSDNLKYVGECKDYAWTESGNIPSAKLAFVNEAVFYLQHVPAQAQRFVVLRKDTHKKRKETLAEYYYRMNKHLLKGVFIVEIDLGAGQVRTFNVQDEETGRLS